MPPVFKILQAAPVAGGYPLARRSLGFVSLAAHGQLKDGLCQIAANGRSIISGSINSELRHKPVQDFCRTPVGQYYFGANTFK